MSSTPTIPVDVVNRAADECGLDTIGSLSDGSKLANAASRHYWVMLRAILSAAPWNFARKDMEMNLLGLSSNIIPYPPGTTPLPYPPPVIGNPVPLPWTHMYEWPQDCVHARFVPHNNLFNDQRWNSPAPFLVHSYPLPNTGNWDDVQGHDPEQTKVILTNVPFAHLVYTGLMQYPDAWDALFDRAFVLALASIFALPCSEDKKVGMALRTQNRQLAVEALNEARVRDGNEGWTVQDHTPDWMRARTSGHGVGWLGSGWSNMGWSEDAGGVY